MMTLTLTARQQAAVDASYDDSLLIRGPNRSGKTTALRARAERYAGSALYAEHPQQLASLALGVLESSGRHVVLVDEIAAWRTFEAGLKPLFDLTWDALAARDIDPEVAALRSPERFAQGAYRLVRKLRDAAIDPPTFLSRSLAAATAFFANPPNLAHSELLIATKDAYRDSLAVSAAELQRQYRREVDLAKILGALFTSFVETLEGQPGLCASDAVAAALEALERTPELGRALRERFTHVFVDEMQEATIAQRRLLDLIYGVPLRNVTVAGDASAATSTFRGARPERALAQLACTIELEPRTAHARVELLRVKTMADEARDVATHVRGLIDGGTAPEEIALIFRSSSDVHCYTDALLDRGVPVAAGGDVNVFCDRHALDALALLWNVWDPFRHEWMLRTLSGRALALSDASVAKLCSDPPDPQRALFVLDDEPAPTARSSRWDPKRDVRLGWNVLRGDQDAQLAPIARERIVRFRALRARWVELMTHAPFETFVRTVWAEGLAPAGVAGSAHAAAQQHLLGVLLERLCTLHAALPGLTLGDLLDDVAERALHDGEYIPWRGAPGFVAALSVDAARGHGFAHVVVPDARPGSFPRWYVPDAFLWSPKYGMVPRENVGDASASRTAKFSYYLYASKAREAYNAQERRAFEYALSRARESVLVSASGGATRGVTAPEFLEELRGAR